MTDGTEQFLNRIDFLCKLYWKNIELKSVFLNPIPLHFEVIEHSNLSVSECGESPKWIYEADLAGDYQYLKRLKR